jgi:hypothetical protein
LVLAATAFNIMTVHDVYAVMDSAAFFNDISARIGARLD